MEYKINCRYSIWAGQAVNVKSWIFLELNFNVYDPSGLLFWKSPENDRVLVVERSAVSLKGTREGF